MTSSPSAQSFLFRGFLGHLRRLGFHVGVDHYLRLERVLETIEGQVQPQELKFLLCPIFAVSGKQQQAFYEAFDTYFTVLSGRTGQAESAALSDMSPSHRPLRQRRRGRYLALLVVALLAALALTLFVLIRPASKPMQPLPGAPLASRPSSAPPPSAPGQRLRQPPLQAEQPTAVSAPPSQPLPVPQPARPNWIHGILNQISALLTLDTLSKFLLVAVPLLFALYEWSRWRREKIVLKGASSRVPPSSWPIIVNDVGLGIYNTSVFRSITREFLRRREGGATAVDIEATVRATIKSLGYPAIRYKAVRRLPEYVVLIDRASAQDHQAAMFRGAVEYLANDGLFVETYFYDRDPRTCWNDAGTQALSLHDVHALWPDHRLLLFGDADHLIDSVSGKLSAWTSVFSGWEDRAILTPVSPVDWALREKTLASQFVVLPATADGVSALIDCFEGHSPTEDVPESGIKSQREEFAGRFDDAAGLREYLGPECFVWLCACAVYSELQWGITLHLASLTSLPPDLISEENLVRMIRLPWFRTGVMPDELRWELIQQLTPDQELEVRNAIVQLLEANPADADTFAAESQRLEIAVNQYVLNKDTNARRYLRGVLKNSVGIANESLTVRMLERVRTSPADFVLPKRFRRRLYAGGMPIGRIRRLVRVSAAVLLTVGIYCALSSIRVQMLIRDAERAAKLPVSAVLYGDRITQSEKRRCWARCRGTGSLTSIGPGCRQRRLTTTVSDTTR